MRLDKGPSIIWVQPNEWTRMTSKGFAALLLALGVLWLAAVWGTFEYAHVDDQAVEPSPAVVEGS